MDPNTNYFRHPLGTRPYDFVFQKNSNLNLEFTNTLYRIIMEKPVLYFRKHQEEYQLFDSNGKIVKVKHTGHIPIYNYSEVALIPPMYYESKSFNGDDNDHSVTNHFLHTIDFNLAKHDLNEIIKWLDISALTLEGMDLNEVLDYFKYIWNDLVEGGELFQNNVLMDKTLQSIKSLNPDLSPDGLLYLFYTVASENWLQMPTCSMNGIQDLSVFKTPALFIKNQLMFTKSGKAGSSYNEHSQSGAIHRFITSSSSSKTVSSDAVASVVGMENTNFKELYQNNEKYVDFSENLISRFQVFEPIRVGRIYRTKADSKIDPGEVMDMIIY